MYDRRQKIKTLPEGAVSPSGRCWSFALTEAELGEIATLLGLA
jgi:hypothetical protein